MTDGLEMGDSSGAAVAVQPRQEVVVHTVREVSGTSWPTLTRINYDRVVSNHEGQAQSPTALECY